MTYDEWMQAVDDKVQAVAGCSVHDLPDFLSRDSYDAGEAPVDGARLAFEGIGLELDDE